MAGDGPGRLDRARAALAAASADAQAEEARRDRLDAALDRGEATFAEVAAANARVRRARDTEATARAELKQVMAQEAGT